MSKQRVHELAKEFGKTNKDVMDFLKSKNIDVKSHMSTVEDKDAEMVRANFRKGNVTAAAMPESEEKPKKKLIQVFRPQNASHKPEKKAGSRQPERENPVQGGMKTENTNNTQNRHEQSGQTRNQGRNTGDNRQRNYRNNENRQGNTGDRPNRYNNGENRGENRQGGYRNNDNRQGGVRNNENRQGSGPRNNDNRQGGFRNNDNRQGGFRNNDNRQGGYRNNENRQGGPRNNENRQGGGFRNNENRQGGGFRNNDNRQGGFRNNDNRQGGFRNNDKGSKFEVPKLEFVEKDSRKANRDNKKKDVRKDEYQNNNKGGKRPNQGGGRRPNQRLPKALQKPRTQPKVEEKKEEVKEITLPEKMTIRELAEKMKMQPSVIVKKLFMDGIMVTVNHEIDFEKAQEIALDYDIIAEPEEKVDVIEELLKEEEEDESLLVSRPPVVCVMGHVDHGKTSLLDCIRNTHVTDREAGGITQHIGAYVVTINGQKITFLDTPGHEAFTAMRMRGANATDIAILVVAADDGVMPQTIEAINHAKAAGVEIIVAINKIDKPSANVERVKQELSEYELIPEDWGGSTIFVPVSAHTGEGIDTLLEMILLTAEVEELKANPKRRARGLVIEAELDKGKGPVATILVQKGTLKVGDSIAAGACSGKVRAMMDDKGKRVKEAGPSTPVEILGLSDVPNAGEILVVTENDKEAKNFAATFVSENKNRLLEETKAKMSLDDLFSQIQAGNLKELPIIVKADVQGSVEAVKQSLVKLSNEEVVVKVIHGGVGAITESDVSLASASNAIIIGFNVRPDATAKTIADQEGVDVRLYKVIYQAIEDVEAAMKGMLDPVYEEKVIGHAEVRQTFKASGVGTIAGGYVLDGIFQRNCKVRITRGEEQIYEGNLASLKRFKDDVKEVKAGYECGLVFEDFNDIQEEDKVEAYIMVEVPR